MKLVLLAVILLMVPAANAADFDLKVLWNGPAELDRVEIYQ